MHAVQRRKVKGSLDTYITLLSLITGGSSMIWGTLQWWGSVHRKAYAAQRDFQQIQQTQQEQNQTLKRIEEKLDHQDDRLIDVETVINRGMA